MAIRPIVKYPDPRLREPTRAVGAVDDGLRKLVADMSDSMYAANGAGLAAIQIGDPRKLFIIEGTIAGGDEGAPPIVFIDPEMLWLSPETELTEEGCLSFPGIYLEVKRSLKARIKATNLAGERVEIEAEGLYARAIQHENDHLTGRLLVDFAGPLKKKLIKRKMEKAAREEEAESDDAESGAAAE